MRKSEKSDLRWSGPRVTERFYSLRSIVISFSLGSGRGFGPAVVRVRIAKSAVAGNHLGDALFEGSHTAIVNKCAAAPIRARAPRTLEGLGATKIEQHCRHRCRDYERESHGTSPVRQRRPAGAPSALLSQVMIPRRNRWSILMQQI